MIHGSKGIGALQPTFPYGLARCAHPPRTLRHGASMFAMESGVHVPLEATNPAMLDPAVSHCTRDTSQSPGILSECVARDATEFLMLVVIFATVYVAWLLLGHQWG